MGAISCDDRTALVTIIVSVYNVENYARECLLSVLNQTYKYCEILIIDDGSVDGSGAICDELASTCEGASVLHTENRGLGASRNRGIGCAKGSFLMFVDGDDWIEPQTVEVLVRTALQSTADVVECGRCLEWRGGLSIRTNKLDSTVTCDGTEILNYLVSDSLISDYAWGKLYDASLFQSVRFPEGVAYEDADTTWRVLDLANRVAILPDVLFHHRMRRTSIMHTSSARNIEDNWRADLSRYDALKGRSHEFALAETARCVRVASLGWRKYLRMPQSERKRMMGLLDEMSRFVRSHFFCALKGPLELRFKMMLGLLCWNHPAAFALMYCADRAYYLMGHQHRKLYE